MELRLEVRRATALHWRDLEGWGVPSRFVAKPAIPEGWRRARLKDLVHQVSTRVRVEPEREYKMAGVKWYGEGAFQRETVLGKDLSAAYVTHLVPGALVYNRLFAWKKSFAVVPPELSDCSVSK